MSQILFTVLVNARVVLAGTWQECNAEAARLAAEGKHPIIKCASGVVDDRSAQSAERAKALIVRGCSDPNERKKVAQAIKALNATGCYTWSHVLQDANAGRGLTTEQAAWLVGEHARIRAAQRVAKSLQGA
jgi:hypothetical protein